MNSLFRKKLDYLREALFCRWYPTPLRLQGGKQTERNRSAKAREIANIFKQAGSIMLFSGVHESTVVGKTNALMI